MLLSLTVLAGLLRRTDWSNSATRLSTVNNYKSIPWDLGVYPATTSTMPLFDLFRLATVSSTFLRTYEHNPENKPIYNYQHRLQPHNLPKRSCSRPPAGQSVTSPRTWQISRIYSHAATTCRLTTLHKHHSNPNFQRRSSAYQKNHKLIRNHAPQVDHSRLMAIYPAHENKSRFPCYMSSCFHQCNTKRLCMTSTFSYTLLVGIGWLVVWLTTPQLQRILSSFNERLISTDELLICWEPDPEKTETKRTHDHVKHEFQRPAHTVRGGMHITIPRSSRLRKNGDHEFPLTRWNLRFQLGD